MRASKGTCPTCGGRLSKVRGVLTCRRCHRAAVRADKKEARKAWRRYKKR